MAEKENEAPSASKKPCLHQERWKFIDECEEEKLIKKFVPKNNGLSPILPPGSKVETYTFLLIMSRSKFQMNY